MHVCVKLPLRRSWLAAISEQSPFWFSVFKNLPVYTLQNLWPHSHLTWQELESCRCFHKKQKNTSLTLIHELQVNVNGFKNKENPHDSCFSNIKVEICIVTAKPVWEKDNKYNPSCIVHQIIVFDHKNHNIK